MAGTTPAGEAADTTGGILHATTKSVYYIPFVLRRVRTCFTGCSYVNDFLRTKILNGNVNLLCVLIRKQLKSQQLRS